MTRNQKIAIFILRIVTGWYIFWSGVTAIGNPLWLSSTSVLGSGHMFPQFYASVMSSSILVPLSLGVPWAMIIIGAALVLGLYVRISALLGIILMLFFYFSFLNFPHVGGYYIVDLHILIISALLVLIVNRAGEIFGLDAHIGFPRY